MTCVNVLLKLRSSVHNFILSLLPWDGSESGNLARVLRQSAEADADTKGKLELSRLLEKGLGKC